MTLDNFVYDNTDANAEQWNIKTHGYTFLCSYDPANDWIEVYCPEITSTPKGALAKHCKHNLISQYLASELIRYNL